jgi:FlaA1/EpsC-like NDP-sugar epimerase
MSLAAVRYVWRLSEERRVVRACRSAGRRVLIAGAGEGGEQIVRALRAHPEHGRRPIGFLDDDPRKRHLVLHGVKVLGRLDDLRKVTAFNEPEELLIAMPSAPPDLVARLSDDAEKLGLHVTVLPSALELVGRSTKLQVEDIREVTIIDLIGRDEVDRDLIDVSTYVVAQTVLVTGAGGSIGTELCRQLQKLNPRQILLFDHDETNLHDLQLELKGHALLDTPEIILGDVRDRGRLEAVFDAHRPDIVFHVAAHKHLPLLEMHPGEGVKTNVLGTLNVARVAALHGCTHMINISTDKAAEPTSILGATKRVAELVVQRTATEFPDTQFTSVRFGNVLGSRGSVIPTFERQIAAGGPVTITHPDVTRYFMTIPEAAQLVIHAGALGQRGSVFVLDMGEPVKIVDLAKKLIWLGGHDDDIQISYTGLRPGEKMHEDLFFEDELGRAAVRVNEKILECAPGEINDKFDVLLEELIDAALLEDPVRVKEILAEVIPQYQAPTGRAYLGDIYPDGL